MRARLQRVVDLIRRGIGHAGPDRDTLLLILKSGIAATAAWLLAHVVLQAPSATFAPFSALLMVQVTIAQSLDQSVRYALAVVAGVVVAGLLAPLLGPTLVTFAVLMLIALVIGRWRRLGSQGSQVAVAALFAYASFVQSSSGPSSVMQMVSIAGLVVLGCVVGVLTNLVIVPPMRYRSAEYAVGGLSQSLCDLFSDISRGLRDGMPDRDAAEAWMHRARQFPDCVEQTRSSVEHAAESMRFNPRRLLMRGTSSFDGHRAIVNALGRASEQTRSMTQGLYQAADSAEAYREIHEDFLRTYSSAVGTAADAARILGSLHSTDDLREENLLDDHIEHGRAATQKLNTQAERHELDGANQWPVFGALQIDAHRLVEEFAQSQHELAKIVEAAGGDSQDTEVGRDDVAEGRDANGQGSAETSGGSGSVGTPAAH